MDRVSEYKYADKHGYIHVYVFPENPFFSMANSNSEVAEHRLIIAKSLGRCLESNEVVHHRNGIKSDNRIENLELLDKHKHSSVLQFRDLWDKVDKLEEENRVMTETIKGLRQIIEGLSR